MARSTTRIVLVMLAVLLISAAFAAEAAIVKQPASALPITLTYEPSLTASPTMHPTITVTATASPIVTTIATATASPTATPPVGGLPDLTILHMRVEEEGFQATCSTSSRLGVRVTVANQGQAPAGPFSVSVDGAELGVQGLAAGAEISLWFEGYNQTSETHAVADSGDQIMESDESNNERSERLPVPTPAPTCTPTATATATPTPAVVRPLPDLIILRMRVEEEGLQASCSTSSRLGVRVTVANQGQAPAGPFSVSVDGAVQGVQGLAAGAEISLWFEGYNQTSETHAVADSHAEVIESDETNNARTGRLPVPTPVPTCTPTASPTPTGTPPSNLDVFPPALDRFEVQPRIANEGAELTWVVTDAGGSHLARVEFWRSPDRAGQPDGLAWHELRHLRKTLEPGLDRSEGTVQDLSPTGTWWYRIHAVDGAGNWAFWSEPIRAVSQWWVIEPGETFADVPWTHWSYPYVERLYAEGVIAGCQVEPERAFCPARILDRAEGAVFVVRGWNGSDFTPPEPVKQIFEDEPLSSWSAKWSAQLWQDGFTKGCSADPLLFCPENLHNQAEAAVFFLRMLNGPDYMPAEPAEVIFSDLAQDAWYTKWLVEAFRSGLLGPCDTGDEVRICALDPIPRSKAAYMMFNALELH